MNARSVSIQSAHDLKPTRNARAPWIPFPDFPVDIFLSDINAQNNIAVTGSGPGVFVEVFGSDLNSELINLSATTTDDDATDVHGSTKNAVNVFGSDVGGDSTNQIDMIAPNGSVRLAGLDRDNPAGQGDDPNVIKALGPEGTISINGQGIGIDRSQLSATKDITAQSNGFTLAIRDSSELASLAGQIALMSQGGEIDVANSVLTANAGEILIDTELSNANSTLTVMNSTLSAEAIRMRAFSSAGDALIVNNSTMNAARLIELYAEGASTLRFQGNVNLNSPDSVLAGQTVQVDSGGRLTASGLARIFADQKNYNQGGFGDLSASEIREAGFSSRPGFGQ